MYLFPLSMNILLMRLSFPLLPKEDADAVAKKKFCPCMG
jgi:hypothetical protein